MKVRLCTKWLTQTLLLFPLFLQVNSASARPLIVAAPLSPYDVIDAVNALRAQHGLSAYSVNSILMGTAQAQADYMAGTGAGSHIGPGGTHPYERALAAGYPLAGEIPPGFFSENWVAGPALSPSGAIQEWTQDDPHLNTMTSPWLVDIGAGVATAGGMVYYVIDCARPLGAGELPASSSGVEATFNAANEIIVPVSVSTPNAEGQVLHEVKPGQSLWQIATTYGVKIADIRSLNQLPTAYVIQPGDKLLVKKVPTATSTRLIATATLSRTRLAATSTSTPATSGETAKVTASPEEAASPAVGGSGASGIAVAAIVVTALVAAGLVAWAGRSRSI